MIFSSGDAVSILCSRIDKKYFTYSLMKNSFSAAAVYVIGGPDIYVETGW